MQTNSNHVITNNAKVNSNVLHFRVKLGISTHVSSNKIVTKANFSMLHFKLKRAVMGNYQNKSRRGEYNMDPLAIARNRQQPKYLKCLI